MSILYFKNTNLESRFSITSGLQVVNYSYAREEIKSIQLTTN